MTGHDVTIVDNLSRRKIDVELGCDSLTPIAAIEERCRVWNSLSGSKGNLKFEYLDLHHNYAELVQVKKNDFTRKKQKKKFKITNNNFKL